MANEKSCVFCDRRNFEERLIGENDHFYFIATLGQITDGGYILLVPKRHVLCVGAMEAWEIQEIIAEASRIDHRISQEYHCPPIMFEHGIVGQTIQHAHIHFVPVRLYLTEKIRTDFPGKEIDIIPSLTWLRSMYLKRQEPYLFWNNSNRESVICWNPPAPPQYFRRVIAELMNRPERTNWRKMDLELDRRLWSETVKRLKKYF
jgi:diadenosine tetraphosphate (Ap4A) HIT family hydrolase